MSLPASDSFKVPLFPLPGIVLFPGTLLPLRVFEPRYLQLLADALASEKLIGMAQLKPGSFSAAESGELSAPPIYSVLGVGRIVAHETLADGTSHIALVGQSRCRIKMEIPNHPYRVAKVAPLQDRLPHDTDAQLQLRLGAADLVKTASALVSRTLEKQSADKFKRALKKNTDVGSITDLLASIYIQDCEVRQALLEDVDVLSRLKVVVGAIEKLLTRPQPKLSLRRHNDEICLN